MRRTYLFTTAIGLIIPFFLFAQTDTSSYKKRKLTKADLNFILGYYQQDGSHSAVTGGTGTETLTNLASHIVVSLTYKKEKITNTFSLDLGIDHYTSASSDNIDPATVTSASYQDTRYYPSFTWKKENHEKRNSFFLNVSASTEYDYFSSGFGAGYGKYSKNKNRQFNISVKNYIDLWTLIYPIEIRYLPHPELDPNGDRKELRYSFLLSNEYKQVINRRMNISFFADVVYQNGLLSTPFNRVYFSGGSHDIEHLPQTRFKLPLAVRFNYFIFDQLLARSYYRFYNDSWGITAHTFSIEPVVKIKSYFSVYPFYRFHIQTAADYFGEYGSHFEDETYFTSDYDLAAFTSNFIGLGSRYSPVKASLAKKIRFIEVRAGKYIRSDGLTSTIATVGVNVPLK